MKAKLYTIRLNEEEMNILDELARKTHRSKAGVIRRLLYEAGVSQICGDICVVKAKARKCLVMDNEMDD